MTACDEALGLLAGDPDPAARLLRIRVGITRAWSELETSGLTQALRGLQRARAEAQDVGSPVLVALTHIQEGVVQVRVGNWRAAVEATDAVPAGSPLDPSQWCALWINRGFALIGTGDLAQATTALETARDLAAAHGLVDQEFKARHNLACLAFVDGDLPRALSLMREADAMDTTVARDRARLDHAEVLIAAGLLDGARARLRDTLVDARADRHRLEVGEISLHLARCDLAAGDLESAREHARTALSVWRTRQADELVREAALLRATVDVTEGRDLAAVVEELGRRNDGATGRAPGERAAIRLEAEARLLVGDAAGAEQRLGALSGDGAPRESLAANLHDALVRARLADATGRPQDARHCLDAGNRLLATHQYQSSSLDVRAALATHGRRLAAYDVERAVDAGDAAGVLTTVERWRAVSHRVHPVSSPPDPVLSDLVRELRRLRQLLADGGGSRGADLGAQVDALELRVAEREWSLAAVDAEARAAAAVDAPTVVEVAAERGSTVAEFFESRGTLHVAVVDRKGVRVSALGPVDDVATTLTRLRRDLRARASAGPTSPLAVTLARATTSSLAAVDALVAAPLGGSGRVVVVPSRSLGAVPWNLLPALRGRPVTCSPSLTRWVRGPVHDDGRTRAPTTLAALAGPGLARSLAEAAMVRSAWGAAESDGTAGSADVVTALASARVVHLAAHGTHEAQSPLFSSVRMADGPLFAHEFPRPVAAEHVALSACDVGQAAHRPGDEPLGLAVALVSLGAASVLGAVAPVADDLAADAMVDYHRILATGSDAAQAWAAVVENRPDAGVFGIYGSDWSASGGPVVLR